MDDLISRQAVKEWIENWFTKNRLYHPYAKNNNIPIPELYDILEQMPSAQPSEDTQAAFEQGRIQGHVEIRTELLMQLKEIVGDEVWANI